MIDMSNRMLYHIGNLNTQNEKISYQMATGRVLHKGSDDALLHSRVINIEDKIRVTNNLKLQIDKTRALNDTADTNVAETKRSLDEIKINIMKALNDGMDRHDKLALATNLRGIRENLIDRVNTKVDGEYIFSGSDTTKETMVKDKDYEVNGKVKFAGDGFLRSVAVQPGSYRDRGITAYDVIFNNATKANADEQFTFSEADRIIDENGHEWKLSPDKRTLQKFDKNGDLEQPVVKIDAKLTDSKEFKVDLGVGANADANGDYKITLNSVEYKYSASNATAQDIFDDLKSQLENDGYTVSASLENNDQFTITHTSNMSISVEDTDSTYDMTATNEKEASGTDIARHATYTIQVPTEPAGRIFEAKHNYFDDLNVIINALEGHTTQLDGTKGAVIENAQVDKIMKEFLGKTTHQFDATNIGHGELGGRNHIFEIAHEKLEAQSTHYNILLQESDGADLAKLAMDTKSLEITYQSLYTTISKMNQLSLINFIK